MARSKGYSSEYNHIFAQRLQASINKENITKAELARRVNITRQSLNSYLTGKNSANVKNMKKLASVLHVNPEWLAGRELEQHHRIDIDDGMTIFTYQGRDIPPEDMETIKKLVLGSRNYNEYKKSKKDNIEPDNNSQEK